jgi:hypothetical protein
LFNPALRWNGSLSSSSSKGTDSGVYLNATGSNVSLPSAFVFEAGFSLESAWEGLRLSFGGLRGPLLQPPPSAVVTLRGVVLSGLAPATTTYR